ncbi:MAG: hypothetical protein ABIR68_04085, partial [Ilumatobacteraceae bacterium]
MPRRSGRRGVGFIALVALTAAVAALSPVALPTATGAPARPTVPALPPSPADSARPISDPALVDDIAAATRRHVEGTPQPNVAVEV